MAQKIGIDATVFIYLFETHPQYVPRVEPILNDVQQGRTHGVLSSIGVIEILTGPKQRGRHDIAAEYRDLLVHFPNLIIAGINEQIVEIASELRAAYNIATPDAIHIATAIDFGASAFITNDKALTKVDEIEIRLL